MKGVVERASVPAPIGGTGFQPVRPHSKIPVPPKSFQIRNRIGQNLRKNFSDFRANFWLPGIFLLILNFEISNFVASGEIFRQNHAQKSCGGRQ
jgi:hypothetical protein